MVAQQYAMRKSEPSFIKENNILERNGFNPSRKRRRKRKRKKVNQPEPDFDYPDFYEDKNYVYIDDSEVDKIQEHSQSKRKWEKKTEMDFDFKDIDYDDYEFSEVGLLNFATPSTQEKVPSFESQLSKRKFRPPRRQAVIVRRQQFPKYGFLRVRPR